MCKKCSHLAILVLSLASLRGTFALAQPKDTVQLVGAQELQEPVLVWDRKLLELGAGENETSHGDQDELQDNVDHHDDDHNVHDEEGHPSEAGKPWGEVILACLLINLATLSAVVFITGEFVAKHVFKHEVVHTPQYLAFCRNAIPSFACGAILATTVFLILPESLELIGAHFASADAHHEGHGHRSLEEEEEHKDGQASWRFGACVIGGFLLPVVTALIFPHGNHEGIVKEYAGRGSPTSARNKQENTATLQHVPETEAMEEGVHQDKQDSSLEEVVVKPSTLSNSVTSSFAAASSDDSISDIIVSTETNKALPQAIDWHLFTSIMAGDFFHNFADGILVGTSFMLCSKELAVAISAATIYHEIAQEVADYFLLTRVCHLSPCKALTLNFLGGLSVLVGGCFVLGLENMTNLAIGCILAVGSGVYLYVSVAECYPRAREAQKTLGDKALSLVAFTVGVVPIGVVLLTHGHCEA